ncbi:MAG: sphingomyelin phosphodiesterase [Okeania sp. SIO2F4]|uniref:sphingomyelin phosphodiesterase n=1 Tax=Okeania sp. SIO2F4 TaxID=2607790 RepID=UPI00142C100E|nr:sphingomyelin phosphodiesterase [Okeania sp. SIO2F4]NES02786.1 sphingomyelin phosphodiesterase [Okeania sp. SIO2F4]
MNFKKSLLGLILLGFGLLTPTHLVKATTTDSVQPQTLNVLSYNIYMRPKFLFWDGQDVRSRLLPNKIQGYDVIIFQEAFDNSVRNNLLNSLKSEYPYQSKILGSDRGIKQDGGVIIVSKWPIEAEDQRLFGNVCAAEDCLADKGVLYAQINKQEQLYHLFGTHAQAGRNRRTTREQQFRIIKSFIDSKQIPAEQPVIIGGDFNVNQFDRSAYESMKTILDVTQPPSTGLQYTSDGQINDLKKGNNQSYLDYIFYSNNHLRPVKAVNEVLLIRADKEWKKTGETNQQDLSDHYPVYGRFEFGVCNCWLKYGIIS